MKAYLNRVWQEGGGFFHPTLLRRNVDMLRLQGYQLYEVNFGCPDDYARWKHQASQWNETHVCLGGGK